jgi:hypothetical protein
MDLRSMKNFVLCVVVFAFALTSAPAPSLAALPSRGIALSVKQTDYCSALVPAGWNISSNAQGSALDADSGDRTSYAGWGVLQVNRGMQQFYGGMYGDPQTSMQTIANTVVRAKFGDPNGIRYTSAPRSFLKYFLLRTFASQRANGVVFYHLYPVADPNSYIESFYMAVNSNSVPLSRRSIAQAVAVSIRCRTQLVYHAADSSGDRGGSKPNGCGGEGNLRGYNKELGWQYAHTNGGTNKLFDLSDWRENGPQGAGYYATVGNSLEKLELGRSDDC